MGEKEHELLTRTPILTRLILGTIRPVLWTNPSARCFSLDIHVCSLQLDFELGYMSSSTSNHIHHHTRPSLVKHLVQWLPIKPWASSQADIWGADELLTTSKM